jgi:hypothetical protein
MAKTKKQYTPQQIEELAKTVIFLGEQLSQVSRKMNEHHVESLAFFGDSIYHAVDFIGGFYKNAESAFFDQVILKKVSDLETAGLPPPPGAMSAEEQTKAEVADIIRRAKEKGISVTQKPKEPKETKKKR